MGFEIEVGQVCKLQLKKCSFDLLPSTFGVL